jgi:hypothetical protein
MPAGLRLINGESFDADMTRVMGLAYEEACAGLKGADAATREAVAKRIIEAARSGERDVGKLAGYGLKGVKGLLGAADTT